MKRAAFLIVWAACGFWNYGHTLGGFDHEYPMGNHLPIAILGAIAGPIAMPAVAIVNGLNYWRLDPPSEEERWQAFHKEWPELSKDYFEREWN